MADIPYGDYFSVEMRFDVVRGAKPNTCEVSVTMSVPFSKKTVFTSRIKQGAREDSLKQYEQAYVRMARQELARARAPAVSSHTSVGAVAKVDDLPEEWRETVQGMLKVRACRIFNRNPLTEISSSYDLVAATAVCMVTEHQQPRAAEEHFCRLQRNDDTAEVSGFRRCAHAGAVVALGAAVHAVLGGDAMPLRAPLAASSGASAALQTA